MSKLTEAARMAPCQIRLPCCNYNPETTVAAHFRSLGLGAGMGVKPHDIFCAHSCSTCHDVVDGRRTLEGYTREEIRAAHAIGVLRTQCYLIELGLTVKL